MNPSNFDEIIEENDETEDQEPQIVVPKPVFVRGSGKITL